MLKKVLKLDGAKSIDKSAQKSINGGKSLITTRCRFGEVFDTCQMRCIVPSCNPQNFFDGCLANGFTCSGNNPWDT